MTDYLYACTAVCRADSRAIGNALAAAIDPSPGGDQTFNDGHATPVYPAGTTFSGSGVTKAASNPPSHYAAFPLLKATGYAYVQEFQTAGPYPLLNGLGFSDAQIAAAKAAIQIDAGPRSTAEPNWRSYIESLGYTLP